MYFVPEKHKNTILLPHLILIFFILNEGYSYGNISLINLVKHHVNLSIINSNNNGEKAYL